LYKTPATFQARKGGGLGGDPDKHPVWYPAGAGKDGVPGGRGGGGVGGGIPGLHSAAVKQSAIQRVPITERVPLTELVDMSGA
jgi:hypothetical protein